jgi:crossover junction endodeoxyribonuclease RuvC
VIEVPVRKIKRRGCKVGAPEPSIPPEPEPVQAVAPKKGEIDLGLFKGSARHRIVIGIDSSATAFGLAALSLDDGSAYAWVHKSKLTGVERLADIDSWLRTTLSTLKLRSSAVEIAVMEAYGFASQKAHTIGEVGGVAKLALHRTFGPNHPARDTLPVAPNTLKKFTTGSGNAEKSDMKLAIFRKWGVEFKDDNQADAFALCKVGAALISGVTGHAYESDVIKNLERQWVRPSVTT